VIPAILSLRKSRKAIKAVKITKLRMIIKIAWGKVTIEILFSLRDEIGFLQDVKVFVSVTISDNEGVWDAFNSDRDWFW